MEVVWEHGNLVLLKGHADSMLISPHRLLFTMNCSASGWAYTCWKAKARAENSAAAAMPAAVPSKLTAPSVPLGTRRKVVLRYVVLP